MCKYTSFTFIDRCNRHKVVGSKKTTKKKKKAFEVLLNNIMKWS